MSKYSTVDPGAEVTELRCGNWCLSEVGVGYPRREKLVTRPLDAHVVSFAEDVVMYRSYAIGPCSPEELQESMDV